MTRKRDFYTLLGLTRNASADDIRKAYFDAAQRLHPDKNTTPGDTEFFLDIQEAYEVLSNPRKRAKYDAALPPEKPPDIPLDQRVLFSRQSLIRMTEPQLIYVLMEFSPPANSRTPSAPSLNLCLVLDRSTSMQGVNMDVVKATAIQIMRKMKPQDIFSVVAFSDRAEEIIPASRSTDLSKHGSPHPYAADPPAGRRFSPASKWGTMKLSETYIMPRLTISFYLPMGVLMVTKINALTLPTGLQNKVLE